ncbi:hypothetical protein os1_08530 [Comamonadaceae bacterium OS-1]|nr:hypothetical protein os1_08530 [Comamonadaceae bacterium OS-1]
MTIQCPKCHSKSIDTQDYAKKVGGTIGTVAGAASGMAGALSGAEVGLIAGTVLDPGDSVLGVIACAVLGGLLGGVAGCTMGAKLGEVVDSNILDNCRCLSCGYRFSPQSI